MITGIEGGMLLLLLCKPKCSASITTAMRINSTDPLSERVMEVSPLS